MNDVKDENVIEVHDVSKKFKIYYDKSHNLKEKLLRHEKSKYEENWVLKGISFEVKKGEVVGLIGKNGCGKSTTLKLLTRIIYPDQGTIEIQGRISSLLELGAGFHPDLSGKENIYLNAAVFGLTRKEIDQRVDDIIQFSELGEYIQNPIRTYSSGMYMKLAFSVAINVNADILLIDEILGVGDVSFQKKCFEKLLEIKESGTTIVIVSHSTNQIEKICDRSIWIENGVIRQEGIPKEIHKVYLETMEERRLERKRLEEEERQLKQIDRVNKARQKQGKTELEKEREERKKDREQIISHVNIKSLDDYDEKMQKEREEQERLLNKADAARKQQEEILKTDNNENDFRQKEIARLESVIKEKDFEIERLNSVVRQNALATEKLENDKNEEILRLENVISEKEDEMDRLNNVILEKDAEIDRINLEIIKREMKAQTVVNQQEEP